MFGAKVLFVTFLTYLSCCLLLPCIAASLPCIAARPRSKLYWVGMRQSAAWGLYLVAGTTAHHACLVLSFLLGGSMVYQGAISAEQLTSFMFYVQMVTSSSLAVCDQYGAVMEVRVARWLLLLLVMVRVRQRLAPGNSNVCRSEARLLVFRLARAPEQDLSRG
jgi:hypothetical protein